METAIKTGNLPDVMCLVAQGRVICVDDLELCYRFGRLTIAKYLLQHCPNAYPSGYLTGEAFLRDLENVLQQHQVLREIRDMLTKDS